MTQSSCAPTSFDPLGAHSWLSPLGAATARGYWMISPASTLRSWTYPFRTRSSVTRRRARLAATRRVGPARAAHLRHLSAGNDSDNECDGHHDTPGFPPNGETETGSTTTATGSSTRAAPARRPARPSPATSFRQARPWMVCRSGGAPTTPRELSTVRSNRAERQPGAANAAAHSHRMRKTLARPETSTATASRRIRLTKTAHARRR